MNPILKPVANDIPLLILAGGRATRLKGLSVNLPKYLMPIGDHKCFADEHLAWAHKMGFRKIFLSVGYLADQVIQHCKDGSQWGLHIEYIHDGDQPLGTGGAVKKSLSFPYQYMAVTYGDTLLNFEVEKFLQMGINNQSLAAMTLFENQVSGHICNADFQNGKVKYNKIHPDPSWKYIDYGFLLLQRDFVSSFGTETPLDLAVPLSLLSEKGQLDGFICHDRFWEIGSPEALQEFQKNFV